MADFDVQQVQFHYINVSFPFNQRTRLKFFLLERLAKERLMAEAINYIFCNDEYLLQMNQAYLQHDTYTDIITFPLSPKGSPIISDIYVSIDRVRENAVQYQTSFKRELHRVIFHGLLHLIGYKDKTKAQVAEMRSKEEDCLNAYFRST